jgi:hypothetical protein
MSDLLKGFVGGTWSFLLAWLLPAAAVVGLAAILLMPAWVQLGLRDPSTGWDLPTRLLALGFAAIVLSFVAGAASTPLYRFLEGYSWPRWLQNKRIAAKRAGKAKLWSAYTRASGLQADLLYERYARFPSDDEQVAPTGLGNALRVMETYGRDRYGLDSQTFWTELSSVVPDTTRQETESARALVDFLVASFYASLLFAVLALGTFAAEAGTHHLALWLFVIGVLSVAAAPGWYLLAVQACSYWSGCVQALVNLGRVPLAKSLGLTLPASLSEEREMWLTVTDFANAPYKDARTGRLNQYRARAG